MIIVTRKQKIGLGVLAGVLILCGMLLFLFLSPRSPFSGLHNDLKSIDPGITASYTDLDGNSVSLETFKGKPIVINSWATWMPFSKDELPMLTALSGDYKDKVNFIAINRMEDKEVIKSYLTTYGIKTDIPFLVDPADTFYKAIEGFAMPETVIYDREGVIVLHVRGVVTEAEIKSSLEALLE